MAGALRCDPYQCIHSQCQRDRHDLDFECAIVKAGWSWTLEVLQGLPYHFGVACCIWNLVNDDYARCLSLAYLAKVRSLHDIDIYQLVFLRNRSCINCSISGAFDNARNQLENSRKSETKAVVHLI